MKSKKSNNIKKIVVKSLKTVVVFEVDSTIFDDVHMEAATRLVDTLKKSNGGSQVAAVIECHEKKDAKNPEKHYIYNSYFVLINAAMHEKAEHLRESFKREYGVDLRKESICGKNT